MRMLALSLKAITPPVHSQYRPTGHVTSRKVNIRAADCRIRQNSVVNSTSHTKEEGAATSSQLAAIRCAAGEKPCIQQ